MNMSNVVTVPAIIFHGCLSLRDRFFDDIIGDDFNETFVRQHQQSIHNQTFRNVIASWSQVPNLESLTSLIRTYPDPVDRIWLVFCWVAQNISYGNDKEVNYFSPHSVFFSIFIFK